MSWLHIPLLKNWLKINDNDSFYVSCKYCNQPIQSKLSIIKKHAFTKKHIRNSEPFKGLQKKIHFNKNDPNQKLAKKCEARFALYIACHSSINPVNHLIGCEKENHKNDPITSEISLARTKCTSILKQIWGPYFKQQLKRDLANSPYSLIIDEATDITNLKYLGIIIKYFSAKKNEIITTFLSIEECEDCTAEGIVSVIKKVLNDFDLNIENLSGLGTDNAKVMVGAHNSVHKKLQDLKTNKHLTLVPCACHSLQLSVTHAVSKSFPPNLEFLSNETFSWFSKSAKRQMLYKNLYETIHDGIAPLKITRTCPTRWMSIETNMRRISEQWEELKTHFGIVSVNEKCYTAKVLYELYNDEKLFLLVSFLKNILKDTQYTNKVLQAKNCDPLKILDDLYFLVSIMAGKIYIKEKLNDIILNTEKSDSYDDFLLPNPYLGFEFESLLKQKLESNKISVEEEQEIRNICITFLKELVYELKCRLPKNILIFKKIATFSIQNALKLIKEPIISILEEFNMSADQKEKIQSQWSYITEQHWETKTDTTSFWIEVYNFKNSIGENPFKELSSFVLSLLVLPFSNAEVERLFSLMGLIKSKLRSKMKSELLQSIIQIRQGLTFENACCFTFNIPEEVIDKIGSAKKYKKQEECEDDDVVEILNSLNNFF